MSKKKMYWYARDLLYFRNKVFDNPRDAMEYIPDVGIVEQYELRGDYYYFVDQIKISSKEHKKAGLAGFGEQLCEKRIHKDIFQWLLVGDDD